MIYYLSRKLKILILIVVCALLTTCSAGVIALRTVAVDSAAIEANTVKIPIVMYHHILKQPHSWGNYVISPEDLEGDIQYIQSKGYQTVFIQDLINFVNDGVPLPEKPIILSFDDGQLSNYAYAYPLLQQYHMKAVISVVGSYTDRYTQLNDEVVDYAYLQWKHIQELEESGYVEFQNHSYDLHKNENGRKGVQRKAGESKESYQKMLTEDVMKVQQGFIDHGCKPPTTFTYPFGAGSGDAIAILKDLGFQCTLSCAEGVSSITYGDPSSLYHLKRYNRPHNVNREKFFAKLLED